MQHRVQRQLAAVKETASEAVKDDADTNFS